MAAKRKRALPTTQQAHDMLRDRAGFTEQLTPEQAAIASNAPSEAETLGKAWFDAAATDIQHIVSRLEQVRPKADHAGFLLRRARYVLWSAAAYVRMLGRRSDT